MHTVTPGSALPFTAGFRYLGKIKEAQEVQEAAAAQLREDLVYVGKKLNGVGCEVV